MLELQTLDNLERDVSIAELGVFTAETANYLDEVTASSAAGLARAIERNLQDEPPTERSAAVPLLFSLKIRMGVVLDRLGRLRHGRIRR